MKLQIQKSLRSKAEKQESGGISLEKPRGWRQLLWHVYLAASMTSEANRRYLVNSVRIWSGDDTKTVVDNDEENERANIDEDKAIADIEEKLE